MLAGITDIHFSVTAGCNLACRMCALEPGTAIVDPATFHVPYVQFEAAWRPALPYLRNVTVRLDANAGDVLTHPEYADMASLLLPFVSRLSILTNGTRLFDLPPSAFSPKLLLHVSILGHDAATHEELAVGSSWDTIWSGIDRVVQAGGTVRCNHVLTTASIDHLCELAEVLSKHGVGHLALLHCQLNWRGESFAPSRDAALHALDVARGACSKLGLTFSDAVTPYLHQEGRSYCSPTLYVTEAGGIRCPVLGSMLVFRRQGYLRCLYGFAMHEPYAQLPTTIVGAAQSPVLMRLRESMSAGHLDDPCRRCLARCREYDSRLSASYFVREEQ